jgi:hypothetical protein
MVCIFRNRWNIFHFLYSEAMVKQFNQKTQDYSNKSEIKRKKLNELFKPNILGSLQNFMGNKDFANIISGLNPSNFDTFKNLQLSLNNMNYNTLSVNNIQEPQIITQTVGKEIFRKPNKIAKDFLLKQRRRSIKNNKVVFVHTNKKKKEEGKPEVDEIIAEDGPEINYEVLQKDIKQGPIDEYGLLPNGKKPRGSRYRGVSRNGNQWQVTNC